MANRILDDFRKLQSLLDSGATFIAFDTETTGLSASSDRIIEIGAVKFDKNGIIDKFETLVNPQKNISSECTAINHITNEMMSATFPWPMLELPVLVYLLPPQSTSAPDSMQPVTVAEMRGRGIRSA